MTSETTKTEASGEAVRCCSVWDGADRREPTASTGALERKSSTASSSDAPRAEGAFLPSAKYSRPRTEKEAASRGR